MRTLTQRELNRALLARQLLLERTDAPLPRVLERMGCLQAQYAPSMYYGLWSRMASFERDRLTRALERRTVIQGTLMRVTIHLVSRRDYWPLAVAVRQARRDWWLRSASHREQLSEPELVAAARTLRPRLAEGPMRVKDIDELLGRPNSRAVGAWLDLVRVPPSGTWERRRADLVAAAEDWVGPEEVDPSDALDHLVRRYLGGFGPAPPRDIANWAGLPVGALAPALERLKLRRFRSESGDELLDLPRAPLPHPDTPAPPRFLPTWDATLLSHANRTGILPAEHRPRIFSSRNPQSLPTFLVDGVVAGAWRFEDGRVRLEPFGSLGRAARSELEEEAERLAAFHA